MEPGFLPVPAAESAVLFGSTCLHKGDKHLKIAAIIGEFNPFHNGHKLIVRRAREHGADRVIALMSGDYVQRGVPAVTDRHVRAHMALLGGVDAVISYPTRFASSTAESFAYHAIDILDALECVDMLVFGSECGNIDLLDRAAEALVNETDEYRQKLHEGLKQGMNFPTARAAALPEFAEVLREPNNILGVEYLKAIKRRNSSIVPYTHRREGGSYLDDSALTELASAAAVRHALAQGTNFPGLEISLPKECIEVLRNDIGRYGVTTENDYSLLLIDRLWKLGEPFLLSHYLEVTDELANTIVKKRNLFTSFDDFAERCSSKNITMTHIYRAFLHIILDIKKDARLEGRNALYTQMLGFRKESVDVVSLIQKSAKIPVIMNPPAEMNDLNPDQRRLFEEEMQVSNLYESIRSQKSGISFENVLTKELVKV